VVEREGRTRRGWAGRRVPMPTVFSLSRNYEETASALASIRAVFNTSLEKLTKAQRRRGLQPSNTIASYRDFTTIEYFGPAAALVLASEYDRVRSLVEWPLAVIDRHRWRPQVRELLADIGFFELLKIQIRDPAVRQGTIRIAPFSTGDLVGNEEAYRLLSLIAEMIVSVDAEAIEAADTKLRRLRLFDALVEATENARHHAYPAHAHFDYERVSRWWMTGAVDQENKRLTMVVYDHGISIPGTIHHWAGYGRVRRGLMRLVGREPSPEDSSYDGIRLHLAMSTPVSSTRLEQRGKGLQVLKSVVDHCTRGRLRIVSRAGEYTYEIGRKPLGRQLPVVLPGTLIEWDLWL